MPRKNGKGKQAIVHGVVWLIAIFVFVVDFLIKFYLRTNLPAESIPIIKNILHITVVFNSGAAFGILKGKTQLLICISIVFVFMFWFLILREKRKNLLFLISCGLIFGGAISNLYDRVVLGFVVDYIDIRIWPVFNLSDFCISVGAILFAWQSWKESKEKINRDNGKNI